MLWIVVFLLMVIVILLGGGGILNALVGAICFAIIIALNVALYHAYPLLFWGVVGTFVAVMIAVFGNAMLRDRRSSKLRAKPPGSKSQLRPLLEESVLIEPQIYQHPNGTYLLERSNGTLSAFRQLDRARLFRDSASEENREPQSDPQPPNYGPKSRAIFSARLPGKRFQAIHLRYIVSTANIGVAVGIAVLAWFIFADPKAKPREDLGATPRKTFAYLTRETGIYCTSRFAVLAGGKYESTCSRLPAGEKVTWKGDVPLIEQRDLTVRDEALRKVREADRMMDRLKYGNIVAVEYQGVTYYTRDQTGLVFKAVEE